MTPEEYSRYNAAKAASEFGRPMSEAEFRQARKQKLSWVKRILPGHSRVADYGAGSGWLKEMCAEMDIVCVEIDEIETKGSLRAMAPVDLIVCITVLEHMTPEEVGDFFDTCATKTGRLLIATNNPRCAFSHYVLWDDITHVRMYSEASIQALLAAKGWTIEEVFYEDDVLRDASFLRRLAFSIIRRALGPMFLSSTCNYWCITARSPQHSAG